MASSSSLPSRSSYKKSPDGTEEFTDRAPPQAESPSPGQRNQRGSRRSHPPPPGAARKVDTERVRVGGRQSADSLVGHR